jgi:uncharacterized protein DUF3551
MLSLNAVDVTTTSKSERVRDLPVTPAELRRPAWRQRRLAARRFGIDQEPFLERAMNKVCKLAMIAGFAFSAFAFAAMAGSSAEAGPIVPPGHYCMTWDIGGSDCSFTSYAQCQATAAGLDAECYGETLRDEEHSQRQDRRGYNSRAQMPLTLGR